MYLEMLQLQLNLDTIKDLRKLKFFSNELQGLIEKTRRYWIKVSKNILCISNTR